VVIGLSIHLFGAEGLGQVVTPLAAFLILQSLLSAECSLPQFRHLLCGHCKGTSIHFLTSPPLPYSPLVHIYFPHTSVPSPGTTPKADDSRIQSPMTLQMSTFHSFLCSHLNSIGRALDALGHIHMTLRHPPLSHGWLLIGGLVLGGLVL
jgi:hypothetical protein